MADKFKGNEPGLNSPGQDADAITPNNDADLPNFTRALYVGGDGDVRATFVGGQTVTLVGLRAGVAYPFRISRVFATGTTADNLVGLR